MKTRQPKPDPYTDLSHVYANPEGDDAGQDGHDRLNQENPDIMDHMMKAFAHAAGIGEHPVKLKRPTKRP
jgi:hypothetical protein